MSLTLTLERGGGEVSGSGTNIELDGTIAGGAIESVEMYGDTEQTTYSGKNLLLPIPKSSASSGLTASYDATTGVVTLSGTANNNWSNAFNDVPVNLPAGTYTFSATTEAGLGRNIIFFNDSTNILQKNLGNNNTSVECVVPQDVTKIRLWLSPTNGTNYTGKTFKAQLESGSQATSFEPYVGGTASPNPDYPQEVQTVTGEQTITISNGQGQSQEYEVNLGKNLFDKDNFPSIDGFIRADNYTLTSSASNKTTYIKVNPNTTYTFSGFALGVALVVGTFNKVPALGDVANARVLKGASDTTVTITTGTSDSYIAFMYQTSSDTLDTSAFQIEKGSTATTYAPYFTPIELCKIGTYQDYIYKSGEDWYVHKEINKYIIDGTNGTYARITTNRFNISGWPTSYKMERNANYSISDKYVTVQQYETDGNFNSGTANMKFALGFHPLGGIRIKDSNFDDVTSYKAWVTANPISAYAVLATATDTKITNSALITQLNALNEATTYDGTTVITVSSENLAGSLEVTVSTNIAKTYTEVEIGSPFTITDVEGKSSNTTLDGNVYVDWAYNKKQYSFDLFNLTPQDYADIRAFYDYQFNNSAFPTITVPELNIDKLPVYMEISSRNIINQCLLTDKLTIKFRETVQP